MELIIQRGPEKFDDPRFKSPDEVLQQAPNAQAIQNEEAKEKIAALQAELKELRHRYNTDINAWKEYEKRVVKWKELVLQVVEQLKANSQIKSK